MQEIKQFRSNSQMAQFYIKKLLADAQEHSTEEILNYVHAQTGGKSVKGKRFTDETIRSQLWAEIKRAKTPAYEQIRKGWYQSKSAAQYPLTTDHEHKEVIYFLVEQARCLIQAGSTKAIEGIVMCWKASEFLIGEDAELMQWLVKRLDVKPFEDKLQDYDTEEFEGKNEVLRLALKDLQILAADQAVPTAKRTWLTNAEEIIAEFYGMAA